MHMVSDSQSIIGSVICKLAGVEAGNEANWHDTVSIPCR